jgi:2-polyprenyl-6-methoxyphenol hydroxylase-like FAD-dependent oxidoreductase
MYDAIVIGARCAGSPTAMLLAQKGYHVLLLDRAHFPSDTLSTHNIQVPGSAALQRWGLLDAVIQTNCPPVHGAAFHSGPVVIRGNFPAMDGVNTVICPRRTILDPLLAEAAVVAGVELREDVIVEDLLFDGEQVVGIRGRTKSHNGKGELLFEERARLVIGADGKHSQVAKVVRAPEYHTFPARSCAYYTYWSGLDLSGGEMYALPQVTLGIWPTNNGLAMIYSGYPIQQFGRIRTDIEGAFWSSAAQVPGLTERLRAGRPADRFYGTADLPAFYRAPFGPGWALVGDAGMTQDPLTGLGIGNAFRDAERMVRAVDAALSGQQLYEAAMTQYQRERDKATLPAYDFTAQLATFEPPSIEQRTLFAALSDNQAAADQFFGVLTGSVPMNEFFSPGNLVKVMGMRGIGKIMWGRLHGKRVSAPL